MESYELQAEREMWDEIARNDQPTAADRIREARRAQERAQALADPDCQRCSELGRACRVHAARTVA